MHPNAPLMVVHSLEIYTVGRLTISVVVGLKNSPLNGHGLVT